MNFKTRGPISLEESVPYILRPADHDLAELVQKVDYVALIGSKLSGKTSMLMRLWTSLAKQPRFVLSYINLSSFSPYDEARWYKAVYNALVKNASGSIPTPSYDVEDAIDFRQALLDALQDALKERILVILMDDVETVPMEIRTAFFATLREMFVSRGIQPAFRRICFVLAGSFVPDELIPDPSISPFRVAEKVYIEDALLSDLKLLIEGLNKPQRPITSDVPARIFEWTEGHLYLTQRLCERLDQRYPSGQITPEAVDQIVERHLYDDELFENLETKLKAQPRMVDVIQAAIGRATSIRFTRTNSTLAHAWLLGCIKPNAYGNCIARNAIYENVLRELIKNMGERTQTITPFIPSQPKRHEPEPLQGRYVLESVLKRGVLTHLYRARDLQTNQYVAVKQLLSMRGGDVIAWRRFQREGEALRRLNHPNIVSLIDTFHVGEFNYIVMEYVDGGSLDSLLNREGRQPIPLVINILLQVADALGYAHEQNIIHRDLKPSNILMTQDLAPRLADFGVAHFAAFGERITATYSIVGTPAYLCPEGYDNSYFTPAEDVWSLGVTLFEMLTGTLPFTGRTQEHIRYAVQHDPIPDVRAIRPDVPEALSNLVRQMLQRDPAQRLPNGRTVQAALLAAQAAL